MSESDISPGNESDIAVVGMAAHFPGARNVHEFWRNLRSGTESIQRFTDEQLLSEGVARGMLRDPAYVKAGAVLPDMEYFDADFFGFSERDATIMDPQHRHLLECAWEALEDAGHPPDGFDGSIGVFAGCGMNTYMMYNIMSNPDLIEKVGMFLLRHTGNDKDFLSTRISYDLNLKGPSISVQTACSTSLVAIHLSCQSLLSGECDMALAGGVTIEFPHRHGYRYQEGGVLSPDGRCRAFDQRAQGTVFGSGAGLVVLRRLEDALRDGDCIRAVIKGTAINNDGSDKVGFLAPSVDGQAAAIAEALSVAEVDASSIQYIETHGTGTSMGDPIEVSALSQAFAQLTDRKQFCGLGSVKTNIGHLDTAAGVANFIKVALALQHREIPPSLNYEKPNEIIDFEASPFYVNSELTEWKRGSAPRRAGVSSLGVGGTNAHIIVEEAPQARPTGTGRRQSELLIISGRNAEALEAATARMAGHLREGPQAELADVAYTLQQGRSAFEHRRVLSCSSSEEALSLLESKDPRRVFSDRARTRKSSIAFMFPGVATQYAQMGKRLYETEPVFREHMDRGFKLLAPKVDFDLRSLLFESDAQDEHASAELDRPSVQTPAIFLVEYALAQLWMSLGIEPEALIGLSLGENTASAIAGVISFEDCLGLTALRGQIFEDVEGGGMLSVPLSAAEILERIGEGLDLATINAPEMCAVSGPVQALRRLSDELLEEGIDAHPVKIASACHSRLLDPLLQRFEVFLKSIELKSPSIPFVSNLSGTWITDSEATDPMYWVRHLRNTVRFADGISTLLETRGRILLEVGPGRVLGSLARAGLAADADASIIASMRHRDDQTPDDIVFQNALGQLWACGVAIDWAHVRGEEVRNRVSLPTYPFQRRYFFVEPGQSQGVAAPEKFALRLPFEEWFSESRWQSDDLPQLQRGGAKETWLVFVEPFSEGLAQRVEELGNSVIRVRAGDKFEELTQGVFSINSREDEHYEQLLRCLSERDLFPQRIVHSWSVTGSATDPSDKDSERLGFESLMSLARALSSEGSGSRLQLAVLSDGMQSVDNEPLLWPHKATLLGPCRVIPREFPEIDAMSIDLPVRPGQEQVDSVLALLLDDVERPTVAIRNQQFWVPSRVAVALESGSNGSASPKHAALAAGAVVLITGGMGGIGMTLARSLGKSHGARLVLTSRSGLPPRDGWQAIVDAPDQSDGIADRIRSVLELEQDGAEVLVCKADVTDETEMTKAVDDAQARFGAIHGVIHAAGTLHDGLIAMKDRESARAVLGPKVDGAAVLERVFEGRSLDFMILCSSTSSLLGLAGQADYTAANAFLNAFARARTLRGAGYTTAVCWGTWTEVGMAADFARSQGLLPPTKPEASVPVEHPLLGSRTGHGPTEFVFSAEYTTEMWILGEHQLRGFGSLVPGTGYIEIMRAAAQAAGLAGPLLIDQLIFMAPLHVRPGEIRNTRVALTQEGQGYEVSVMSQTGVDAQGVELWRTHASAAIAMDDANPPKSLVIADIVQRCPRVVDYSDGDKRTKQEDYLLFGPRWRNLQWVRYGEGEAVGLLQHPEAFLSDLDQVQVHPALLDLATGFGLPLVPGYDESGALYVPMMYDQIQVLAPLPEQIHSHLRLRESDDDEIVVFDVTLTDLSGRPLVNVEGFSMRRVDGELKVQADASDDRALPSLDIGDIAESEMTPFQAGIAHGIRPAEGALALDRILTSRAGPEVVVSSLDWGWLLDRSGLLSSRRARAQERDVATQSQEKSKSSKTAALPDNASRPSRIAQELVEIIRELGGLTEGDPDLDAKFVDLGFDSLLLTRATSAIKGHFKVRVSFRQLLQSTPSFNSLSEFIDGELPSESPTGSTASSNGTGIDQLASSNGKSGAKIGREELSQAEREALLIDGFPITSGQSEIWLASAFDQDASRAFSISISVNLEGALDRRALGEALQGVVNRHQGLRITFARDGSKQSVTAHLPTTATEIDISDVGADERQAKLDSIIEEDSQRPFDLVEGPLVRFILVKLSDAAHQLIISAHHIVCDGWSTGGVAIDIGMLYSAAKEGRAPERAEASMGFGDYVAEELYQHEGESGAAAKAFWLGKLEGELPVLELPTDRARPPLKTYLGDQASYQFDRDFFEELKTFAGGKGGTVFSTLLAVYTGFLKRITGQDDVIAGFTTGGQPTVDSLDLVGHCVNLHPFRSRLGTDQPFSDYMDEAQAGVMDCMEYRDCTYGELLSELSLGRDPSRLPLVSTYITYEVHPQLEFFDLKSSFSSNLKRFTNFDLELYVEEAPEGLRLCFHYNRDLHDKVTIDRWLGYMARMLRAIVAGHEGSLAELPMLAVEEERMLLSGWSDAATPYPKHRCMHELFEETAAAHRSKTALISPATATSPQQALTYGELNAKANQLARHLISKGVSEGDLVGLSIERSPSMLIGMLGILKAGAAYVPLDPHFPIDRLRYMLSDCGAGVLVSETAVIEGKQLTTDQLVLLDRDAGQIEQEGQENLDLELSSDQLAYVIYTSGSTGKPKGVELAHRGVVNFLYSMATEPGLRAEDRFLAVTTLSFDIAVLELMLPLTVGAKIILAHNHEVFDGSRLVALLDRYEVTVMQATPATWRLMLAAGWSGSDSLKVLCGGEPLPIELASSLNSRCGSLWNMYGPTETTIWSTIAKVAPGATRITIGSPIANTSVYVLDSGLHPVPVGTPGELYIGGDGLARGYLDQPDLTSNRFIQHTFKGAQTTRLYRTGDLARRLYNGDLECLGRSDSQIKLRGFRIELGEIESVLEQYGGVDQAAVVAWEDLAAGKHLAAYVRGKGELLPGDLREHVRAILPDYMVPLVYIQLAEFPLTPNGKVDRKALPDPDLNAVLETDKTKPRNGTERRLVEIWSALLGLKSVGVHGDFFEMGGDSLLAVRLVYRISDELSVELSLRDVFETSVLAEQAELVDLALDEEQGAEDEELSEEGELII